MSPPPSGHSAERCFVQLLNDNPRIFAKNREIFSAASSDPTVVGTDGGHRRRIRKDTPAGEGGRNGVGEEMLRGCCSAPSFACRGDISSLACRRTGGAGGEGNRGGGAGGRNRAAEKGARGLVPTCRGSISPAVGRGVAPRPFPSFLRFLWLLPMAIRRGRLRGLWDF